MGLPFLNVILPYILFKELLYISTKQNKFFVHFLAFILSFSMAVFLTFLDLKGVYKLFTLLYFLPIFIMQFIINRKDFSNAR